MIGLPGAKAVMVCFWWSFAHIGSPHIVFFDFDSVYECEEHRVNMSTPLGAVDFQATCIPGPSVRT